MEKVYDIQTVDHAIITLTNGKRVANFSSPHTFKFTDGNILPAVTRELSEDLSVDFIETPVGNAKGDIKLAFALTSRILREMSYWHEAYKLKYVDVVFCPLPMLMAMAAELDYGISALLDSPFRSVRMEDRIAKLVSIDKQCLP